MYSSWLNLDIKTQQTNTAVHGTSWREFRWSAHAALKQTQRFGTTPNLINQISEAFSVCSSHLILFMYTPRTQLICALNTSSPFCSVSASCTASYPRFCWSHFGSRLFRWPNKNINSLHIELPVWRVATEHERRHLERFPANSLLPGVPKALC